MAERPLFLRRKTPNDQREYGLKRVSFERVLPATVISHKKQTLGTKFIKHKNLTFNKKIHHSIGVKSTSDRVTYAISFDRDVVKKTLNNSEKLTFKPEVSTRVNTYANTEPVYAQTKNLYTLTRNTREFTIRVRVFADIGLGDSGP